MPPPGCENSRTPARLSNTESTLGQRWVNADAGRGGDDGQPDARPGNGGITQTNEGAMEVNGNLRCAGRSALVTGGGSGIGLGVAHRLVAEGAAVTICGRTEAKLADAVAELRAAAEQAGLDAPIGFRVADVTIEAEITAAVGQAAEATGSLDICVANAGGSFHLGSILDAELSQVQATFDLNMLGTFLTIKAAGSAMKPAGDHAGGGSIIAVSSGAGRFPHRHLWAYGTAKAGLDMMVRYAAEELASLGIRVNSVQPGIIDDELMAFITAGGKLMDDYLEQTPISRAGTVEEVAAAVAFLASDDSSWITGENIGVDGGHHLRRGANYELIFG